METINNFARSNCINIWWLDDRFVHKLGVFASFPLSNNLGSETRLIVLPPFEDETTLNAEEHSEFLSYVLGLYQKSWNNVVCIIWDICNTNKALSNKMNVPMMGFSCVSYDFLRRRKCLCPVNLEFRICLHLKNDLGGYSNVNKLSLTYLRFVCIG